MTMMNEPTPTPAEASAQLTTLKANSDWLNGFMGGDGPKVAEYQRLSEIALQGKDAEVDRALAGVVPSNSAGFIDTNARDLADHASFLRAEGVPDPAIRQSLSGAGVSREEYAAAERTKNRLMRDQDWTRQYLAGNGPQREQMALLNVILSGPIKEKA